MGGTDPKVLEAFMDLINGWLSARLGEAGQEKARMARVAETLGARQSRGHRGRYLQSRAQAVVFAVFGALAEAARP
jgi:hypothetical protein